MNLNDIGINFQLTNREEIQKFLKGAITRIQANRLHYMVNWLGKRHWQPDRLILREVEGYPKLESLSASLLINIIDRFEVDLMSILDTEYAFQKRKNGLWYRILPRETRAAKRIKPVIFQQSINIEIFDPIGKHEFQLHI